jgi:hypothetical protein
MTKLARTISAQANFRAAKVKRAKRAAVAKIVKVGEHRRA